MAAFQLTKKAFTLPPTVRTLASGVPSASLLNLNTRAPAHGEHDHHGEVGPRSDVPPAWSSRISTTSAGLVSKNYANGEYKVEIGSARSPRTHCPSVYPHMCTAAPTGVFQQRLIHTSVAQRDAPQVPDYSGYRSKSTETNRSLAYVMIGSLGLLSATTAKSTVTEFLGSMAASADVLALAKVEVELGSIPEGKNAIIKWRGKPVFIRHRTSEEIQEAKSTDWKGLRDPESDESRAKRPEWLVMLGVCTHLGCVPIGEAGDFGGWCVTSLFCYPELPANA